MNKRSTKFYRKNEAEVMKRLGFSATINSGAGWIQKEDGESEKLLCQLKSTDKESISIKQHDLHVLEIHASEAHKLPVFAFQFLNREEVWLAIKESDIEAFKALIRGEENTKEAQKHIDEQEEQEYNNQVGYGDAYNSLKARRKYMKQKEEEAEARREMLRERIRENRRKRNKQWQKS